MKKISLLLLLSFIATGFVAKSQTIDSVKFFTDDQLIDLTLVTDIRALQNAKGEDQFQEASVVFRFPDSIVVDEKIQVCARGHMRREYCRIPPILMNFRNTTSPKLASLGKLKLVIGCGIKEEDEELLLKEFLVYKIYNLLEDKSFRVRLVRVNYSDTRNKNKPYTQYAFLIEDDGDLARRNGCRKKDHGQVLTEQTNRAMMTKVAIFEYMIGNTDWAVPNGHNVKLIYDKKNETAAPFVVPYDFDYCGLVNAGYAVPHEIIGTEKVTERVYRGFPRNMEEIQIVLDVFRAKKSAILSTISAFALLPERTRKEMVRYLDEFFKLIENQNEVRNIFIENARTS